MNSPAPPEQEHDVQQSGCEADLQQKAFLVDRGSMIALKGVQKKGVPAPEREHIDSDVHAAGLGGELLVEGVVGRAQLVLLVGAPQRRVVPVLHLADAWEKGRQRV